MTMRITKTALLAASVVAIGAFTVPQIASAADGTPAQTTEVKKDVKKAHHGKHAKHVKKDQKGAAQEKRADAPKKTQTAATPNN